MATTPVARPPHGTTVPASRTCGHRPSGPTVPPPPRRPRPRPRPASPTHHRQPTACRPVRARARPRDPCRLDRLPGPRRRTRYLPARAIGLPYRRAVRRRPPRPRSRQRSASVRSPRPRPSRSRTRARAPPRRHRGPAPAPVLRPPNLSEGWVRRVAGRPARRPPGPLLPGSRSGPTPAQVRPRRHRDPAAPARTPYPIAIAAQRCPPRDPAPVRTPRPPRPPRSQALIQVPRPRPPAPASRRAQPGRRRAPPAPTAARTLRSRHPPCPRALRTRGRRLPGPGAARNGPPRPPALKAVRSPRRHLPSPAVTRLRLHPGPPSHPGLRTARIPSVAGRTPRSPGARP